MIRDKNVANTGIVRNGFRGFFMMTVFFVGCQANVGYKRQSSTNISSSFSKFLIIYLVTIGQFLALAQNIRNTPKQRSSVKKLGTSEKLPVINNSPSRPAEQKSRFHLSKLQHKSASQANEHIELTLPRKLVESKFKEALKPYQAITPAKALAEIGFQVLPQQNGRRYERESLSQQKAYPDTVKSGLFFNPAHSALIRAKAYTDPYYSILMGKQYLQPSGQYSPRIAEIFILQAMLQANTPEEINLANQAYAEISKLDIPETLAAQLSVFRDQLITEYSLSNPGLSIKVQEGGAIYTRFSDPELFECQSITISADREKIGSEKTPLGRL